MGWQIDESACYAEELRRAEEWMNREYGGRAPGSGGGR